MRKPVQRFLGRAIVPLGAGILVLSLAVSVWTLTLRDRANKRLYLEYEVFKVVTSLTDIVRLRSLGEGDIDDVVAFGLYAPDGSPIARYGSAPETMGALEPGSPPSRFTLGDSSVILIRSLGGDAPGRRMMMGSERSGRMRAPAQAVPPGPATEDPALRAPAFSYIEISTVGFKAEEALRLLTAGVATIALAALYAVIVVMNRRSMAAKDREAKDRELVELGQAARTIAHEIKNPLGVIRIQCGILRRGADEATVAGLAVIDDEAMRLADLADRIRRFLKSGDEGGHPVDAQRFVEDFAARYAGSIESDMETGIEAIVSIDESRITEALDNIVANALEASVDAAEKPRLEVRIKARRLTLCVLDRGPGIPPDRIGRIFEPFFTTKNRGSGLGLALARKNVEAFGGTVSYADRPGGGAQFTVSLPLERS